MHTTIVYNIEDRNGASDPVLKTKFGKLTPDSPFPAVPEGGNCVIVTSGRVPHWRHCLAIMKLMYSGEHYSALAIYDPILGGGVVVVSSVSDIVVGTLIPI